MNAHSRYLLVAGSAWQQCFAWALFSALGSVLSGPAMADIFRCDKDGKTVYSDVPCTGGAKLKIEEKIAPPATEAQKMENEANLGRIAVGMQSKLVERAWGKPLESSNEKDAKGITEHWVYRRDADTIDVYLENEIVVRIARRRTPEPTATAAPQPPPTAATVAELEELERAERAGERRFIREGMTQDQIRTTLGPPNDRRFGVTVWGIGECWIYLPTRLDFQTRTTLCFGVGDTRLVTIERTLQR